MFFVKRKTLIKSKSNDVFPRILHLAIIVNCKMQKGLNLNGKATMTERFHRNKAFGPKFACNINRYRSLKYE